VGIGVTATVIAVLYLYSFQGFSRAVFLFDAALLVLFIVGGRALFSAADDYLRRTRAHGRRALLVGAGRGGAVAVREPLQNPERDGVLAGGLFGVALGGLFTSESMFHRVSDAGSAALVATHARLAARDFTLWDIQMSSPHTTRFGAVDVTPDEYRRRLGEALPLRRSFL